MMGPLQTKQGFCDSLRLVEVGNHKSLIKLNGEYASLWAMQAEHYAEMEIDTTVG